MTYRFSANKDMQKRHLACMMAYGKDMPPTPHGPIIRHKSRSETTLPDDVDPLRDRKSFVFITAVICSTEFISLCLYFHSVVQGIRERIEFLNDMENLGQGKKYRPIIHQEIAQKIRMIESLDNRKSAEMRKEMEHLKYQRPPPKPFPLGELEDS